MFYLKKTQNVNLNLLNAASAVYKERAEKTAAKCELLELHLSSVLKENEELKKANAALLKRANYREWN